MVARSAANRARSALVATGPWPGITVSKSSASVRSSVRDHSMKLPPCAEST